MGKDKERQPAPKKCPVCDGEGGQMVQPNGKAHERGVAEWQRCNTCDGSGHVGG